MITSSDAFLWYVHELTSRVVAETGLPEDRHHLGKIILRSLKDAPDHILQIDGATGEKDTFRSALERSIRCATAFRNVGLKYQDVIVIMAPNHIDLVIPIYASLYLGIMVAGLDKTLGVNELRESLQCCDPKMIFCQSSNVETVKKSLTILNMAAQIIVFGEKGDYKSFSEFLDEHGEDIPVENFRAADFDPSHTRAFLNPTSGSTGTPKIVVNTHKKLMLGYPLLMMTQSQFPTPVNMALVVSPIQWVSSIYIFLMGPIMRFTRVQSSATITQGHVYDLINKYRPDFAIMSPTFLTTLLKPGDRERCDFSSFRSLVVGGSAVSKEIDQEMKKINPNVHFIVGYGLTESPGMMFDTTYSPFGSIGVPLRHIQIKLVDPSTNKEICTANESGELRIKGPTVVEGYYNNPEMTAAAFDEDGWFKTGDIMYRDEYHNYYYVDRLKMLLKYRNHQVSPLEIESVIMKHPGVLDVAVTGIPDTECGDLPVAFVIIRNGNHVTSQEIKDLVKESLTDTKQLRGGVIFVKEFPMTSSLKVDRQKIKRLAMTLQRE